MMNTPATNIVVTPWRAYVGTFFGLVVLALLAVSTLNYLVDPYLIHQWDSPLLQRMRPTREKLSAWGKTYVLAKYRPAVVYIGNSRTELGLPTSAPELFEGKTVFNAALSGASVGDAIAMVGHAARVGRLDTVVWGIDAPSFSMATGSAGLEPELTAPGPLFFARRALLNVKRGLTVDMTGDALRVLNGSFGKVCRSSLAFYGQRDDSCISDRISGWGGTSAAMGPRLGEFGRGDGPTTAAMAAFGTSVGNLCKAGTRVRLYINPTHALTLDVLYWSGKWPAMEQWQRGLALLGERRRAAGCDLRIFDFSGYNSITSEPIPQVSQRREMAHYWEASHYRTSVGSLILNRIFHGVEPVPDDFGIELDTTMLPAHVAALRSSRERYHLDHAQETAFAKAIVDGRGDVNGKHALK
ncbi:hypothetical protein [Janthinobacterium agaricidamnosum]|uniref:Uncharacterized protein n=1 Tax=Janthinobacterium agaricidamnosum NBRC 102515 = DSM 9628 TaxID=1349767 RepID=W0V373_9BURK|nr:hypothetical protein [Janthinobacterium agaricidamnosum]CDG83284.1 hypothetical protein GJA_2652 [Janthinobacterium agaricidamnosum NBRC 102515 = DSM 9628]